MTRETEDLLKAMTAAAKHPVARPVTVEGFPDEFAALVSEVSRLTAERDALRGALTKVWSITIDPNDDRHLGDIQAIVIEALGGSPTGETK